jgi:hypothetical protein
LSAPVSLESIGGGDVVKLVSSSDSSASSSSWFSSASRVSNTEEARSAERGPSSGRGGREMRNWWSYKRISQQSNRYKDKYSSKPINSTTSIQSKQIYTSDRGCTESK